MFRQLFATPRPMPRDVEDEVLSLCRDAQIGTLGLSRNLRHDLGLDCGCSLPAALPPTSRGL